MAIGANREVTFRIATCADILALGQHAYSVIKAAGLQAPDPAHICRMVDEAVTFGNAFVVLRDGVVVGSMCAKWGEDWFGRHTAELGNLWFDKGLPRRSVHRFCIWVMQTLRERGAQHFVLTEWAGSPHPVFGKIGFEAVMTVRVGNADDVLREARKRNKDG